MPDMRRIGLASAVLAAWIAGWLGCAVPYPAAEGTAWLKVCARECTDKGGLQAIDFSADPPYRCICAGCAGN